MSSRPKKFCLLGITGCGKSALANVLLGYEHDGGDTGGFKTCHSAISSVSDVEVLEGYLLGKEENGRRVRIIDTPGCGKGEAEDKKSVEKIVQALRREKAVDAFLFVKNSQLPRYDQQEVDFLQMMTDTIGTALFRNLIIVFTRWSFSQQDERRRKRDPSASTLEALMEELWKSIVQCHPECGDQTRVAMLALDSFYASEDIQENAKFQEAVHYLWDIVLRLPAMDVTKIKAGLTKVEKLQNEYLNLIAAKKQDEAVGKHSKPNRSGEGSGVQRRIFHVSGIILGFILTLAAKCNGLRMVRAIIAGGSLSGSISSAAAGWPRAGASWAFLSSALFGFPKIGALGSILCAAAGGWPWRGAGGACLALLGWEYLNERKNPLEIILSLFLRSLTPPYLEYQMDSNGSWFSLNFSIFS